MKEISDIAHFLAHGMFAGHEDLCDRLESAAETIRQTQQLYEEIEPSNRPEINAIDVSEFVEASAS